MQLPPPELLLEAAPLVEPLVVVVEPLVVALELDVTPAAPPEPAVDAPPLPLAGDEEPLESPLSTQKSLRQVRPSSQPPPGVQGQPAAPMTQSSLSTPLPSAVSNPVAQP